jgi:hypothetical protein
VKKLSISERKVGWLAFTGEEIVGLRVPDRR